MALNLGQRGQQGYRMIMRACLAGCLAPSIAPHGLHERRRFSRPYSHACSTGTVFVAVRM